MPCHISRLDLTQWEHFHSMDLQRQKKRHDDKNVYATKKIALAVRARSLRPGLLESQTFDIVVTARNATNRRLILLRQHRYDRHQSGPDYKRQQKEQRQYNSLWGRKIGSLQPSGPLTAPCRLPVFRMIAGDAETYFHIGLKSTIGCRENHRGRFEWILGW